MRLFFKPARNLCAILCGVWLTVCSPVLASTMMAMDLEALTLKADRILVGTVEAVQSHFVTPHSTYIVTDVTVRSERNLLGVPEGSKFIVRHLGGVVGDIGQRVSGEASYKVGEQVLLFAAQRRNIYYTTGMAQGALHIQRDGNGVSRIQTNLSGIELLGRATATQNAASAEGKSLDEVVSFITACLDRHNRRSSTPASLPKTGRE